MPDDFDLGGCEELPASEAPTAICPVCGDNPVSWELPHHIGDQDLVAPHRGTICQECYTDLYTEDGEPWSMLDEWLWAGATKDWPEASKRATWRGRRIVVDNYLRESRRATEPLTPSRTGKAG